MTTIIALLVLVSAVGMELVNADCQIDSDLINNCCCLGYNNSQFNSRSSGVYTIANFCGVKCSNMDVYCDTKSGGGGWLVIQRRSLKSSTTFHRGWSEYEDGFGDINNDFRFGLRAIHCLTNQGQWELRIDITFVNGTKSYLQYSQFKVGPPDDRYRLSISGFVGITPADPFVTHPLNGQTFKTLDQPQGSSCPIFAHSSSKPGGWWHYSCWHINLNHNYGAATGFILFGRLGWFSPPSVEMKIRPVGCQT